MLDKVWRNTDTDTVLAGTETGVASLPASRKFLRTIAIGLLSHPSVYSRDAYTSKFIVELFTTAQKGNQPGGPPTHEWVQEIRSINAISSCREWDEQEWVDLGSLCE